MVGFSFGLKKAAANSKAAPAKLRKPATFGGDDDDENTTSGDGQPKPMAAVEITELDGFDDTTSTPLEAVEEDRKSKKKSKGLPQPPPPVSTSSSSSTKKASPAAAVAATQFSDLSSALESRKYAEAAASADPSIYDYDAVYDSFKVPSKREKEADNKEKRPRYFDALQKAAETRERDRAIAEEKRLKREREAEGDAFADKEKFVTEAYKRQQEENRRLEEEEKKREEEEAKKNKNKGLTDFYKQMLEKEEQEHAAKMKAAEERAQVGPEAAPKDETEGDEEKSAAERAKEINAMGGNVIINDDGEVVDKRQLLKGGLNVAPKKKVEHQQEKARQAAKPAAATGLSKGVFHGGSKQAMRERQTRMLEAQLEERLKRAREEEEEERKKVELVSKSRKTEADISSAKERYLARKRAAEEARKKGLEDGGAP